MIWKIAAITPDETVAFAAEELQKYLSKIDNSREYIIMHTKAYNPTMTDVIWLGINEKFPVPEVKNPELDDGISVKVKGQSGYISGTNSRSVLLAVYRFLKALGCAFFRPGDNGEVVPEYELTSVNVEIFEAASQRYRVMYSEAAVSEDQLLKITDWLPKIGMNGYYMQHLNSYVFFKQWYHHINNPLYAPENISFEDAEGLQNYIFSCMKKRGLTIFAVGHGWDKQAFDLAHIGFAETMEGVPEETVQCLAMIDGERKFCGKTRGGTQLCYSNKLVQDKLAQAVVDYAKANPMVDCIAFNLSDGRNNFCECEECRKGRPSDGYVKVLNAIDRELTKNNLKTKVIFTAYMDLLWAPLNEKIENPDRFMMKFSPYGRSYNNSIDGAKAVAKEELPTYEINKVTIPNGENVLFGFLKEWQNLFKGDAVMVDYHLMWDHYRDPGYFYLSNIIFRDMKALKDFGFSGFMSCQAQRVFLPTALCMVAMAEALWDQNSDFDTVAKKHCSETFGGNGELAYNYLTRLSEEFERKYWKYAMDPISEDTAKRFVKVAETILSFKPTIEDQIANGKKYGYCDSQIKSWKNLLVHGEIYTMLSKAAQYLAMDDLARAEECFQTAMACARVNEMDMQYEFDAFEFITVMRDLSFKHLVNKYKSEKEAANK